MNQLGGYELADLRVGMSASFAKTITEADIVLFAAVSGDNNALHINAEYAETTIFKTRIAHGMLSASVISAAIANKLPGPGSIYLSQSLRFLAPVRAGDTVSYTTRVESMRETKRPQWGLVTNRNIGLNQHGAEVFAFTSIVLWERRPS